MKDLKLGWQASGMIFVQDHMSFSQAIYNKISCDHANRLSKQLTNQSTGNYSFEDNEMLSAHRSGNTDARMSAHYSKGGRKSGKISKGRKSHQI